MIAELAIRLLAFVLGWYAGWLIRGIIAKGDIRWRRM